MRVPPILRFPLLLAFAVGVCLAGPARSQSVVTSRSALAASDHLDWSALGGRATRVSNPFSLLSSQDTPVIVSQAGHGLTSQYGGAFSVIAQAGSPIAEGTLNGNFAPGDAVLDALDGGTVSLSFPQGVYGGGAQLAVPTASASGAGAFTVQVQAFGKDNALLATFTKSGTFSASGDNSALFLGIAGSTPDIYRIAYTGLTPHYSLFLNRFDISHTPTAAGAGRAHLLWTSITGAASLWTVKPDGSYTSTPAYGPIAGWTAKTIADGPDGRTRLLWTRTDGMCAVWTVNTADGTITSTPGYGPFAVLPDVVVQDGGRWDAVALAVGPDNLTRLQWKHSPDGQSSVWTLAADGSIASTPGFGPYGTWTAGALAVGGDGLSRLLWGDGTGRFAVWTLDALSNPSSTPAFGPIPGWTASAIAGGPDLNARLLLNRADGGTAVWTVSGAGAVTSTPLYGPIPGWSCHGLAVGVDALSRVLWSRADGTSAVWTISADGSIGSTPGYGPIPGWSAVALAAGP